MQKCANQFFAELSLSKSVKISTNFLFVTICQVIACRIGILNRSRVVLHQVYTLITHLTLTNQHQFNVVKLIWCQVIFDLPTKEWCHSCNIFIFMQRLLWCTSNVGIYSVFCSTIQAVGGVLLSKYYDCTLDDIGLQKPVD